MRLPDFGSRERGRLSAEQQTFLGYECLKHAENKERASLVRQGGGTTAMSRGVSVD